MPVFTTLKATQPLSPSPPYSIMKLTTLHHRPKITSTASHLLPYPPSLWTNSLPIKNLMDGLSPISIPLLITHYLNTPAYSYQSDMALSLQTTSMTLQPFPPTPTLMLHLPTPPLSNYMPAQDRGIHVAPL